MNQPRNILRNLSDFTPQVILALSLMVSNWAARACENNTNLPEKLICSSSDTDVTSTDHIQASIWLLIAGMLAHRYYNRRRKWQANKWQEGTEICTDEEDLRIVDMGFSWKREVPRNVESKVWRIPNIITLPTHSNDDWLFWMSYNQLDAICEDIVSEVVWERNTTSELLSNHHLQQSAKSWINESETKIWLWSLVNAWEAHIDIHHLLILIKNPQYQQKIWCLLYYNLHHIPLVQKYNKFFELCLIGLREKRSKYLVGLNKEFETEMNNYNLSEEHLQSLKDRWKSIIEDTNSDD